MFQSKASCTLLATLCSRQNLLKLTTTGPEHRRQLHRVGDFLRDGGVVATYTKHPSHSDHYIFSVNTSMSSCSSYAMGGATDNWYDELERVLLRYRTLADVYDTIKEVNDIEYSVSCLLAVDKSGSIEQALKEDC